jgi:hypothetical protein
MNENGGSAMPNVTMPRITFVDLIDALSLPAYDGDFAYPGSSLDSKFGWFRWWVREALNLKSLSPGPLPLVEKWGPVPDPWTARAFAHAVVQRVAELPALAKELGADDNAERVGISWFARFEQEWCGNEPIHLHIPIPGPRPWFAVPLAEIHPVNSLVAGAAISQAVQSWEPGELRDAAERAGYRLMETGLARTAPFEGQAY